MERVKGSQPDSSKRNDEVKMLDSLLKMVDGLNFESTEMPLLILSDVVESLILSSLSAQLEYILHLNGAGLSYEAKILFHKFKRLVRANRNNARLLKEGSLKRMALDVKNIFYDREASRDFLNKAVKERKQARKKMFLNTIDRLVPSTSQVISR